VGVLTEAKFKGFLREAIHFSKMKVRARIYGRGEKGPREPSGTSLRSMTDVL
jgi:hypothetical protein